MPRSWWPLRCSCSSSTSRPHRAQVGTLIAPHPQACPRLRVTSSSHQHLIITSSRAHSGPCTALAVNSSQGSHGALHLGSVCKHRTTAGMRQEHRAARPWHNAPDMTWRAGARRRVRQDPPLGGRWLGGFQPLGGPAGGLRGRESGLLGQPGGLRPGAASYSAQPCTGTYE